MSGPGDSPNCLNCGEILAGQYCGRCGQRATSRLISVIELLRDAFGDLLELDSRLWRTLVPLLIRPGLLTKDYLEGRRARYMPPFRMYLVLSLVFFVVAFFDPQDELAIFYEPVSESELDVQTPPGMSDEDAEERVEEAKAEARRTIDKLIEKGIITADAVSPDYRPQEPASASDEPSNELSTDLPRDLQAPEETSEDDDDADGDGINIKINGDDAGDRCELNDFHLGNSPDWFKRRFTRERIKDVCESIVEAGSRGLKNAVVENIPAALIILLPLMAFVLKLLYPLSRRYYVEHLLFFVHFHAFFFLILTLEILLTKMGAWISILEAVFTLVVIAASLYIPIYLFLAMRRVYEQGRFVTTLKFIFLTLSYLVGFTLVMLIATAIAVFAL